ncbi:MAG TPA: hypothetical protein VF401_04840 [Candidatus Saccharimonadales bacterium]
MAYGRPPAVAPETPRLYRGPDGESVIAKDTAGQYRYVYRDRTLDPASTVDERVDHLVMVGDMVLTALKPDIDFVAHNRLTMIESARQLQSPAREAALHDLGVVALLAA